MARNNFSQKNCNKKLAGPDLSDLPDRSDCLSAARLFLTTLAVAPLALVCQAATYEPSTLAPPAPPREFRGVWVATVANIDWPSQEGLSTAQQKAELLSILDRAVRLRLNAVIFQVRPACDAMYASALEPWSEYLTGRMGQAPTPFYDPLDFAISEAHKRGLELHAWFNPYRARHISAKSAIAASHITRTHPQIVRSYGKYLWLDPGEPGVQEHTFSVVMDVVQRYDIDAVHFDDYFYPFKEKDSAGRELDFPDEASWKQFGAKGRLNRDDWRRQNVNLLIQRVYRAIKITKPWVKFGISPFGIWRPGNPPRTTGLDVYSKLYADSRKWLAKGWVDYFAPQLYWPIDSPEQPFPVLLRWWAEQNTTERNLWVGLDATKAAENRNREEIAAQIRLARRQTGVSGQVFYSMKSLMNNADLDATLQREAYSHSALVPASPWLSCALPARPRLTARIRGGEQVKISWESGGTEKPFLWILQTRTDGQWATEILPAATVSKILDARPPEAVAVSAVGHCATLGPSATLEMRSSEAPRAKKQHSD
jgi:uncharacterized lipoprotein YddW (UPF0748 family)